MIERLEEFKGPDGKPRYHLRVEFENDREADMLFGQLRTAFPEAAKEPSRRWLDVHENKLEMANAFAEVWAVMQMARQSNDHQFSTVWNVNPALQASIGRMASEAARLLLVLVDVAGRTRARRMATAKDVRRRLQPVKDLLVQRAGAGFNFTPLSEFPGIRHARTL